MYISFNMSLVGHLRSCRQGQQILRMCRADFGTLRMSESTTPAEVVDAGDYPDPSRGETAESAQQKTHSTNKSSSEKNELYNLEQVSGSPRDYATQGVGNSEVSEEETAKHTAEEMARIQEQSRVQDDSINAGFSNGSQGSSSAIGIVRDLASFAVKGLGLQSEQAAKVEAVGDYQPPGTSRDVPVKHPSDEGHPPPRVRKDADTGERYSESTTGEQALGSTWQDGGVEYDVLPEGRGVNRSR
eukprot:jgi/Botrbrau1/16775/Bobra.150_2s0010.1